MLDLAYLRGHVDEVRENIRRRKSVADIDAILVLADERSALVQEVEAARRALKAASKTRPTPEIIARLRQDGDRIAAWEAELRALEERLQAALAFVPNQSSPAMPVGAGEDDNVEVAAWTPDDGYVAAERLGTGMTSAAAMPAHSRFLSAGDTARHHLDLGADLGLIDMRQGAVVSGTRFGYLLGDAPLLEAAIVQVMAQKLIGDGFMWVEPPLLVKERVLYGTSHFPEGRDQVYAIAGDHVEDGQELFLVGSSEPPLFAYAMDRVLPADIVPLKMFAVTPCFRSEVGSWGKDVRGIKRVHQFQKLEMDVICAPDASGAMLTQLRGYNEWLLQSLGIPYRIVAKCTGDCGYLATYEQYDVEVWMPSARAFMETMTATNATDFQARRMQIKIQASGGEKLFAHTVNDTGAALGRILIAIFEHYQQPDGTIVVPDILRPYVHKDVLLPGPLSVLTRG